MRFSLMRDIAEGKLDEHLSLELMVLEEGVAETMGSLQMHFRYYREPAGRIEYYPHVHDMFTGQALMRWLLREQTLPCPVHKGEQEIEWASQFPDADGGNLVVLACGHSAHLPPRLPRRNSSRTVH